MGRVGPSCCGRQGRCDVARAATRHLSFRDRGIAARATTAWYFASGSTSTSASFLRSWARAILAISNEHSAYNDPAPPICSLSCSPSPTPRSPRIGLLRSRPFFPSSLRQRGELRGARTPTAFFPFRPATGVVGAFGPQEAPHSADVGSRGGEVVLHQAKKAAGESPPTPDRGGPGI